MAGLGVVPGAPLGSNVVHYTLEEAKKTCNTKYSDKSSLKNPWHTLKYLYMFSYHLQPVGALCAQTILFYNKFCANMVWINFVFLITFPADL